MPGLLQAAHDAGPVDDAWPLARGIEFGDQRGKHNDRDEMVGGLGFAEGRAGVHRISPREAGRIIHDFASDDVYVDTIGGVGGPTGRQFARRSPGRSIPAALTM